ncbi:flagellar hook-basal body complex protein [Ornithinibacillus sp. L9]|uniref:Flagellar hook protein FlgE n=1 Tax=Ornithinibacillus caprae TaxID=2678566 RepID=A0A6N8FPV2_9BACI|nr:flagellar hook-basal body complex protein [Ornithinibacillus caprae]MUK89909.1 flagellar hook-basal body complex protein [Ornithinibacillus caprae]
MLRSMYAGISGMKNFQTKLDVIGNNISNVNTSGFKKGRVTFQDMMSQMTSGAQGPTATRGGVNAAQVGLGSQLGSIDNIHTQGFRQTTNNPLDFALEGDGMFVVQDGDSVAYTRAGNFYLDEDGSIVNPQGLYLMGFQVDTDGDLVVEDNGNYYSQDENGDWFELQVNNNTFVKEQQANNPPANTGAFVVGNMQIPDNAQSFSVQTNGIVNFIDQDGNTQVAGQVAIANFSNPAGLEKAGSNLFLNSVNAGYTGLAIPESEGTASIVSGSLEMSNVDLSEEFTEMITAQRGFQANTRIITTSDEILQELVNLKR